MSERLLATREVADFLGLSPETVLRRGRAGELPGSTFASNALAAGIAAYELARIMGTSVAMIEAHYGALLDTAHTGLLDRLESFGALEGHEQEAEDA